MLFPPTFFFFFSNFPSSFLVCKSISLAILFAQLLWFKEMQIGLLLYFKGPGEQAERRHSALSRGIAGEAANCFSTSENLAPENISVTETYLSILILATKHRKVLWRRYCWRNASWWEEHCSQMDVFFCPPSASLPADNHPALSEPSLLQNLGCPQKSW